VIWMLMTFPRRVLFAFEPEIFEVGRLLPDYFHRTYGPLEMYNSLYSKEIKKPRRVS
jgi:hypothetical protein